LPIWIEKIIDILYTAGVIGPDAYQQRNYRLEFPVRLVETMAPSVSIAHAFNPAKDPAFTQLCPPVNYVEQL
ncbi:hypothetical protein ACSTHA_23620, partial [Vibrio parahaemolyticus]